MKNYFWTSERSCKKEKGEEKQGNLMRKQKQRDPIDQCLSHGRTCRLASRESGHRNSRHILTDMSRCCITESALQSLGLSTHTLEGFAFMFILYVNKVWTKKYVSREALANNEITRKKMKENSKADFLLFCFLGSFPYFWSSNSICLKIKKTQVGTNDK